MSISGGVSQCLSVELSANVYQRSCQPCLAVEVSASGKWRCPVVDG